MSNVTFFKKNLINSTCSFSFTSALTANASYLYDDFDRNQLSSVASSDTASEIWDITFAGDVSITAFHLANHNFKAFSIQYWSSTAFQDFSNAIATTTNSGTYHFINNFTAVTTNKIRLKADTTIVADAQKTCGGFRVLNSIGELSRNPKKATIKYHENSKNFYTDSKENVFVLFGVSLKLDLEFNNLPETDINTLETCKYLGDSFYVYLSGGGDYDRRGWRIEDIYLCNYTNNFEPKISDNLLANGEDIKVALESVKIRNY